ncbi:protein Hook homolog 3 isoform X2 [Eurytemora carolleeae]|uniref:protein Hook homolog 3 isoform X2 n=1 Tax=Eurytemora carolleeae TaxID=1294199 RepID=UPI000C780C4B|nr:protein Hook homolog 3 isoform X2 [Eurytemora carolleeae]|eukprot:XP_023338330.1 protein Hook homolog 3-like isoform X2 [Eurytemora affinis]
MEQDNVEITALLGWLRTFNLTSEVSCTADLYGGTVLAEALVQIEPSEFTPAWYAGLIQSKGTNYEIFDSILNLLLYYYRNKLADICVADDLPLPHLPNQFSSLSTNTLVKFLKLMLGVAVTCTNKQTFINKIQSLDETAQHALTSCVASFIYTREWTGRLSQLSSTPDLKISTPPGEEVWAQKCHELDFQVAMLKEERENLMAENEDLYGKVRAAQTLSRKDSVKAREFERELAHIQDEFERLRLAYEGTRTQLEAMEVRLRSSSQESEGVSLSKLMEETNTLRSELVSLRSELAGRGQVSGEGGRGSGDPALEVEISEHSQAIQEIKAVLEFQVGLGQEVQCLKDQVDILREQNHTHRNYDQELKDLKVRLSELQSSKLPTRTRISPTWNELEATQVIQEPANIAQQCANRTLLSLESETCLAVEPFEISDTMDQSQSIEEVNSSNKSSMISEKNLNQDETYILPVKLSQDEHEDEQEFEEDIDKENPVLNKDVEENLEDNKSEDKNEIESETVLVANIKLDLIEELKMDESRLVESCYSPETDSGLELTTSENTPFASRPESELILGEETRVEDEVEHSPRQLEMLLEESAGASGASSPRDNTSSEKVLEPEPEKESPEPSDPVLEDMVGEGEMESLIRRKRTSTVEETHRSVEHIISEIQNPDLDSSLEDIQAMVDNADLGERVGDTREGDLVTPSPEKGFDPDDPKVKELEEWELRSHDKSLVLEEESGSKLRNIFKSKRSSKIEERSPLMPEGEEGDEQEKEVKEKVDWGCINSWLIRILIKIFD